ncbi:helicase-related protein [Gephyromycinifex aptenodytis]|uniref:helicase-related protein n=1 Tax=Gephyromycinifex aptenodytis TaxID=2716227 RepID=UPI00144736C2|nr:helicase-related protein [Gephyromycinifex aptenodytis]
MTSTSTSEALTHVAPGSLVVVRDEEWLVTQVSQTQDGTLLTVHGLSELVAGTTAQFFSGLDAIEPFDPSHTRVVADSSRNHQRARLWLEATLRKTPLPIDDPHLAVTGSMLATALDYQRTAVSKALDPGTLRPRILLADAVGLGKTLEIGMILSELVRRGRGERILVVTPRHVLEQMQHELWCRFALPFVRLDSVGIQRIRRRLPATRNPFSVYKRAIISIDTLKNDRYLAHLRKHRWDAVVIDESHNITNSATQNNRLASELAPRTDALILASATPHNGKRESFAELVRLLEPTAVSPEGDIDPGELSRLVVRRHRHSPEVATAVGGDWAERQPPSNRLVPASPDEDAIAQELADHWLYADGVTPSATPSSARRGNAGDALFGWTLAKAFLSSPAALVETARNRLARIRASGGIDPANAASLTKLISLADAVAGRSTGKYAALLEECARIGIGPRAPHRVVIFAERVATLGWLQQRLTKDLKLASGQVRVLHGGLTDVEQQEIVEEFKQEATPIRVLVTGDVASEGVNLHLQCHELIHFDIPWSLIRIEQRNGRIDRYGQKHPPRITTLLLEPSDPRFSGDLRVLAKLMEKEHEAHTALGDSASLMGEYSVEAEERAIRDVLLHKAELDDVVATPEQILGGGDLMGLLARMAAARDSAEDAPAAPSGVTDPGDTGLYASQVDYLREAVHAVYDRPGETPRADGSGGIEWREYPAEQLVELSPPSDLKDRLRALPQAYLKEREVTERLRLATSTTKGQALLEAALRDDSSSSWPAAHYLGPLHPVLDWAGDRVLSSLGRGEVFAVRGDVESPTVLLLGSLTNRAGQTVAASWIRVEFPDVEDAPHLAIPHLHESAAEMLAEVGVSAAMTNPGPVADVEALTALIPTAVARAEGALAGTFSASEESARKRVDSWSQRVDRWALGADELTQRLELRQRRVGVEEERRLAEERLPERRHLRPLLVVVPHDHAVAAAQGGM